MHDIKKVGDFEAMIHFHKEVEVAVPVKVVAENMPAPKAEEEVSKADVVAEAEEAPAAE